jgi:hypothetical protein
MSDDISVIKVYDDEMEASMAQQVLENAGIRSSLLKDDGGLDAVTAVDRRRHADRE